MACTDGLPSLAAVELVAGLARSCHVNVRADVDEAGFVVVDQLRTAAPAASPWRYDADTYARHLGVPPPPSPVGGLAAGMRQLRELYAAHRTPLHEEALLDQLLADLTGDAR